MPRGGWVGGGGRGGWSELLQALYGWVGGRTYLAVVGAGGTVGKIELVFSIRSNPGGWVGGWVGGPTLQSLVRVVQ